MDARHLERRGIAWWVTLLIALPLLLLPLALQMQAVVQLAERQHVTEVELSVPTGQARTFGRAELAAPQAGTDHVRVARGASGQWWLSATADKGFDYRHAGWWHELRTHGLRAGEQIVVGSVRIAVESVEHAGLSLRLPDGRSVAYRSGGSAVIDGRSSSSCPDDGWATVLRNSLRRGWNAAVPAALHVWAPLQIGGLVDCGMRVAVAQLPASALRIERIAGDHVLRAGPPLTAGDVCVSQDAACSIDENLQTRKLALNEVETVVIGRTRFQPVPQASDGDALTFRVLERGAWVNGEAPVPELDEVRQTRAAYLPWRWSGSWPAPELVLSLGMLAIALLTSFLKWYRPGVASSEGFLLSVAAAGLVMTSAAAVAGSRLGEGWHLAILLGMTAALLFGLPRTKLAAAVLLTAGILSAWGLWFQLDLGLRASDTGGLRFWMRGVSGATIFVAVLLGHRALMAYRRAETWPASLALPLAVAALLLLLVQAAAGGEAGVYGIQPVEIAKLALVLLAAHVAALVGSYAPGVVGLRVAGSALLLVLLYLAIVAAALLLVRDFSPLALMALWCAGMVLALVTAVRSAALSLALLFMGALALPLLWLGQADVVEQLQAQGVYGDRLEVWLRPELHLHSGDQFLRAQDLMAGAELRGQEVNGWRVPAAQDDFMASVVAARHGLVGLSGLLAGQISFVMLLLLVAHQHLAHARMAHDGRRRVDHAFRFYALYGGAFILLAHAVLSFGTNLGYLPVMGQPLWGISHANSLRLLFVLPLLLLVQTGETPGMNKGGNRQRHGG